MIFIRKEYIEVLLALCLIALVHSQSIARNNAPRTFDTSQSVPELNIGKPLHSLTGSIGSTLGGPSPPNDFVQIRAPSASGFNENLLRISHGAQQFGLDLFTKFSDAINGHRDFMLSPYSIWSLLLLLTEGAEGNTLRELQTALHLTEDRHVLRQAFRDMRNYLALNTTTITVASLQALFADINQPVKSDYETIIDRDYGSMLLYVDFHDVNKTYKNINEEVRILTRGLIPYTVQPQDLKDSKLLLLSSLYFKGQWKHPFNHTLTRTELFYNENGQAIGNVEMMMQEENFKYVGISELQANVLELPYGETDRLSMLIVLPNEGVQLKRVVHNLQSYGITSILTKLKSIQMSSEDENIELFLPKFSTSTDLMLEVILKQLGINDIFYRDTANLSKMAKDIFVSKFIHTTKIIVNEEGTQAAAATTATLANKATPPKFYLNRPFFYLIVEKTTNLLLFAGQVVNPKF